MCRQIPSKSLVYATHFNVINITLTLRFNVRQLFTVITEKKRFLK